MSQLTDAVTAEPIGERLARLCLLSALVAAPWFGGALQPGAQLWLVVLFLAGVFLSSLSPYERSAAGPVPKIWWGILVGTLLGIGQLIPVSSEALRLLSPEGARWRQTLSSIERSAPQPVEPARTREVPSTAPISVAPSLTRIEVAHLIMSAATMLLASRLLHAGKHAALFLVFAAINGTVIAIVGLWGKLSENPLLPGIVHPDGLGPFANRNNGAGYLLLCITSALGLLVWRFNENSQRSGKPPAVRSRLAAISQKCDFLVLGSLGGLAIMITAVVASLSRGATISLIVGLVTVAVAILRLRAAALLGGAAVTVILLVATWAGLRALGRGEAVADRLGTLSDVEGLLHDGRVVNWRFGWDAAREFLRCGSGLGSYRYAYRPFQTSRAEERFNYPENVFLQTLVEAGVPGFVMLTVILGSAALIALRLARSGEAKNRALGLVAVFVLASQTTHACLDNGFYRPAGFLLLAAICGCFCGAAPRPPAPEGDPVRSRTSVSYSPFAWRISTACMLVGLSWVIVELRSAAPAGEVMADVFHFRDESAVSTETVSGLLHRMEEAIRSRPDDGELRRRTAEFYFALYRRRAVDEIVESRPSIDRAAVWNLATPSVIYEAAARANRDGDQAVLSALRTQSAVTSCLLPAKRHLEFAARAAPMDAETLLYLGELHFLTGNPGDSHAYFAAAAELAPGRPAMLLRIGLHETAAGNEAFGFAQLKRSWSLEPTLGLSIVGVLAPRMDWKQLLEQVAPDSVPLLEELHATMSRQNAPQERLDAIRNRIRSLGGANGRVSDDD